LINERKNEMNKRITKLWMGPIILLAGLGGPANAAAVSDSENVAKLLSEAKTMAFQLKEDAVAMEGFTRMNVSWESHAAAINEIKDHVNALEKHEAKLKDAKGAASPWQKTAIDRIVPYLDELEGYTSAIIERINSQPKRLFTDEYKDFLEANADYATDLAGMIADFVDYGKTRDRMERLGNKLEIPRR
jgi:plasmid replication initiation protein